MNSIYHQTSHWNIFQKYLFRFTLVYFLLYTFPFPIDYIPFTGEWLSDATETVWDKIVPWFGEDVIDVGYEITVKPNGSGDTTWNYVHNLLLLILALIFSIIWSLVDRKRINYDKLYYWSIVFIRYYLGFVLMGYGFAKVFKSQFPDPNLLRLLKPFGEMSPMGLAWSFVGYSEGFNLFTGLGETIGGFLLLFRRTKLIGGLISLTVLSNIVVMNYCYDIPVKLFSTNLLLMTFFILAPDLKRLFNFFILNKTTSPINLGSPFSNEKIRKGVMVFKTLLIVYVLYSDIEGYFGPQEWGDRAPKPPLYGLYDVQSFSLNDSLIPPIKTDTTRWDKMVVNWADNVAIKLINEKTQYLGFEPDTVAKTILVYSYRDSANQNATWKYIQPNPDSLIIQGVWKNDTMDIKMNRRGPEDFPLMKRGFHWINEYPYNR